MGILSGIAGGLAGSLFGGGGSKWDIWNGVPASIFDPPPTPEEEEAARLQTEIALREDTRRAEEAERVRQQAAFDQALGPAREQAFGGASEFLSGRGLDASQYSGDINNELQQLIGLIPQYDTNPGAYLSGRDIGESIFDRRQGEARQGFQNQLSDLAPAGFATSRIPDTADDSILQSILGPQRQTATDQLQSALQRGVLSSAGYQSALGALGGQEQEALSRLGQIGGDALEQGRTGLRDIRSEGQAGIDQFRLGGPAPDIGGIGNRLNQSFTDFGSNLEGNIRNALGGDSLFDVGRLIGSARQPSFNPAQSPEATTLAAALAQRERDQEQTRGIGNTGAF